jgi:hypothetical protein
MKNKGSLPCSQQILNRPYAQADESNPIFLRFISTLNFPLCPDPQTFLLHLVFPTKIL